LLEVELKKTLPGFVLDVGFSVDGGVLGILGPSGSGKTMTLQCIAGLVRPDRGSIRLNGRVLFDSSQRMNVPPQVRNVGLVFQNYSLFPHLTARENIAYGIRHRPRSEANERVRLLVEKMRLTGLENRRPRQLSAGQQQRVAVARALAPEPEVLLLDEPFSALDSLTRERLESEIMEVRDFYQGSIILVTHDLAEAYRLSSRLAVYESGKVLQCGPREKVVSCPANRKVARMMGMRNCLDGRIAEIGDAGVWVTVAGLDARLRVAANGHRGLTINQPVAVGIHPEYVLIAQGPGQNTFPGSLDRKVDAITSVSCHFRVDARCGETSYLEAVLPNSGARALSNGEQYYLHLPPDHVTIIGCQ
jgi:molybdate transport system ATP-binding protein